MLTKVEVIAEITNLIIELHNLARNVEEINAPYGYRFRDIAHQLTIIENAYRYSED